MTKPITNAERAERAEIALLESGIGREGGKFFDDEGSDLYDVELLVSDLLTDLMHYAQQHGLDFTSCLDDAKSQYEAEVLAEGAP